METTQKINVNVKKTVEQSVAGNSEFHFYVDELAADNSMPTYIGRADEKYTFDEMDDAFFEFLERKSCQDGIFIRLVFSMSEVKDGKTSFILEYGNNKEIFVPEDLDDVLVFEFADFGIRVKDGEVTFGASLENGCGRGVYFAEFGSKEGNRQFLSLENPLNKRIIEIMEGMIK